MTILSLLFCVGYNTLVFNNYSLMNINSEANLSAGKRKHVRYIVATTDETINKRISQFINCPRTKGKFFLRRKMKG